MLSGNFTALVTPFLKNKNIDYAKLKELTIRQIEPRAIVGDDRLYD